MTKRTRRTTRRPSREVALAALSESRLAELAQPSMFTRTRSPLEGANS